MHEPASTAERAQRADSADVHAAAAAARSTCCRAARGPGGAWHGRRAPPQKAQTQGLSPHSEQQALAKVDVSEALRRATTRQQHGVLTRGERANASRARAIARRPTLSRTHASANLAPQAVAPRNPDVQRHRRAGLCLERRAPACAVPGLLLFCSLRVPSGEVRRRLALRAGRYTLSSTSPKPSRRAPQRQATTSLHLVSSAQFGATMRARRFNVASRTHGAPGRRGRRTRRSRRSSSSSGHHQGRRHATRHRCYRSSSARAGVQMARQASAHNRGERAS